MRWREPAKRIQVDDKSCILRHGLKGLNQKEERELFLISTYFDV